MALIILDWSIYRQPIQLRLLPALSILGLLTSGKVILTNTILEASCLVQRLLRLTRLAIRFLLAGKAQISTQLLLWAGKESEGSHQDRAQLLAEAVLAWAQVGAEAYQPRHGANRKMKKL